jgi:hypothetical protein
MIRLKNCKPLVSIKMVIVLSCAIAAFALSTASEVVWARGSDGLIVKDGLQDTSPLLVA